MVQVHNFSYGLLNPVLAYLISCLGCFLGLQCSSRARAMAGAARARWLLLAAVSIGVTGIWVMHFIAMLGYTIMGQAITYNVPVTILSMVIAVAVVAVGLFIVGFGPSGDRGRLLLGGSILGIGVAGMHYMGIWAMRMPDTMGFSLVLLILSVIIAMVAGTAALWAANTLNGLTATLVASLIMGVAVSGMHYTGMAALHVYHAPAGGMLAMGAGASATSFLLPLILGISIVTFLVTAIVTMAPTAEEMREDAALMERIATLSESLDQSQQRRLPPRLTPLPISGGGPPADRDFIAESIWGERRARQRQNSTEAVLHRAHPAIGEAGVGTARGEKGQRRAAAPDRCRGQTHRRP